MIALGNRPITTKMHGVLDYATSGTLMMLPGVLRAGSGASRMLMGAAASSVAYSLITRYELGLVPLLPMPTHLKLDAGSALAFLAAPLFFRSETARTRIALGAVGVMEMGVVLLSQDRPE
jgi:hypothetical protein